MPLRFKQVSQGSAESNAKALSLLFSITNNTAVLERRDLFLYLQVGLKTDAVYTYRI